jgi:hypothetical protein
MMISPEMYLAEHEDKKYKDLLPERDRLVKAILEFENKTYDPELDGMCPAPEVFYQMNLQYLGKLCELISEKYNKEYVWGEGDDS